MENWKYNQMGGRDSDDARVNIFAGTHYKAKELQEHYTHSRAQRKRQQASKMKNNVAAERKNWANKLNQNVNAINVLVFF